jgi:predicted glycoside hydrolase/deacetylase ChbG (UPF0249 family)
VTRRPLVIVADDFGLTAATSQAIVTAHLEGVVTATSVLAVAPTALDSMSALDVAPDLAVGVHLALVGEDPPLLSAREVPTLVGKTGAMAPSWRHLMARLGARRLDVDDVRRELLAQIEAVAERHPVTHLDSHQHVHLAPPIAAVVTELATAVGVGRVRVPQTGKRGPQGAGIRRWTRGLRDRLDRAGIAATDRFAGIDDAGHWNGDRLRATLTELGRGEGSVEINTHPGAASDAARARYRWGYDWVAELEALTDPATRTAVERASFDLAATLPAPTP